MFDIELLSVQDDPGCWFEARARVSVTGDTSVPPFHYVWAKREQKHSPMLSIGGYLVQMLDADPRDFGAGVGETSGHCYDPRAAEILKPCPQTPEFSTPTPIDPPGVLTKHRKNRLKLEVKPAATVEPSLRF